MIAARRMKGVVNPQQAPTSRNPRIQRKTEGWGSAATGGVSGSIVEDMRLGYVWDTRDKVINQNPEEISIGKAKNAAPDVVTRVLWFLQRSSG